MGRIILTIAGPWSSAPHLSDDFSMEFSDHDSEFANDFIAVGQRAQSLWDEDIAAIQKHVSLIQLYQEFDSNHRMEWARKGVEVAQKAVQQGAAGVFVETGCKAMGAQSVAAINPKDAVSLFHFYVEVLGDETQFATEGMQAFGLPNVAATYDAQSASTAQAVVFALAARMACDGFQPADGGVFRASESAPLYRVSHQPNTENDPSDPYNNPAGLWLLSQG